MLGLIIAILVVILVVLLLRRSIDSVTGKNLLRYGAIFLIGIFLLLLLIILAGRH
jgi:hypothetical protein